MKGISQLSLLLGVGIVLCAVILCNAASARQSSTLSSDDVEEQDKGVIEGEEKQEEGVINGAERQEEGVIERETKVQGPGNRGKSNKRDNSNKRVPPKRKGGGGGGQDKGLHSHNYTTECECGKKLETTRIIGGVPTTRDEYPWQAALLSAADDSLLCGGSLINNLYILTSAKCVDSIAPEDLIVRLRDYNLNKPGQSREITKNVEKIIVHQNYEEEPRRADIALLKLDSALTLSQLATVRPICLPSTTTELYQRERAVATGWGSTDQDNPDDETSNVLREINLKVISNSKCRSALPFGPTRVKKNMLCAGNDNKNICLKDEGGPLAFLNSDGYYEQIGIASFTDACGSFDEPAVFTRVNQFLPWIARRAVGATYCSGFSFPEK